MPTQVDCRVWNTIQQIRPHRCFMCMLTLENETVECDQAWPRGSYDPSHPRLDLIHVTCDLSCAWYIVWSGVCYIIWMWNTIGHMSMEVGWIMAQRADIRVPPAMLCPVGPGVPSIGGYDHGVIDAKPLRLFAIGVHVCHSLK
eukprot:5070317-Amphidinium_carterae.1